jgi:hypothetical protein
MANGFMGEPIKQGSLDDAQTTRDAEPIVRIHFPPAASQLRT